MKTIRIDNSKEWTVEDYLHLEEMNNPCELINGALVMSPAPSPYHQLVSGNLYDIIKAYAKKNDGTVFYSPIDLFIDQKNVLQPDLVYISSTKRKIITNKGIEGPPDLIIEIISPSNSFSDRNLKKKKYFDFGVSEYWIVDPGNKTLDIYPLEQTNKDVPFLYRS